MADRKMSFMMAVLPSPHVVTGMAGSTRFSSNSGECVTDEEGMQR